MIQQIFAAIWGELSASWPRTIAEFVQFAILIALFWVVAFGFGKRRGFVANMLSEYRKGVADRIESASSADELLAQASADAERLVTDARAEATRLVDAARAESAEEATRSRTAADAEAERILERAHAALANEREQMRVDLRDELVELVTEATRLVMNEALTVAEQRERIEQAVAASMEVTGDGHRAKTAPVRQRSVARPA